MIAFGSLRSRLLVPLMTGSLISALLVAWISYDVAGREVERSMESSFGVLQETLRAAPFPLTPAVLSTLADLTGTELATFDARGRRIATTLPPARLRPSWERDTFSGSDDAFRSDWVDGYLARSFHRQGQAPDGVRHVLVMFDRARLEKARRSAALFPLATGLCCIALLALVGWWVSDRMIRRIAALRRRVQRVAAGDFAPPPSGGPDGLAEGGDELGDLSSAIGRMAGDLASLWNTVKQQERQRLIHQLAAGMAHQLRNSLTGARMALDLHAQQEDASSQSGLQIARRELARTEDYVQRILSLAKQDDVASHPGLASEALAPVQERLQLIADHHRVQLEWNSDPALKSFPVADTYSLVVAIENLVLNAIEAGGDRVQVDLTRTNQRMLITVRDNGPGLKAIGSASIDQSSERRRGPPVNRDDPDADLANLDWDPFDLFVSTKPEGLGLGLSLVRRSAEILGGKVKLSRVDGWTQFRFEASMETSSSRIGQGPGLGDD